MPGKLGVSTFHVSVTISRGALPSSDCRSYCIAALELSSVALYGSFRHPVCKPLQLSCGTVGNAGSLLHSGNFLRAAQQRCYLGDLDGVASSEYKGNRCYRGVICSLCNDGDVVLSEGVTAGDDLDASEL